MVKTWAFLVGIVEFLEIETFITPSVVSIPENVEKSFNWLEVSSDNGTLNSNSISTDSSGLIAFRVPFY